MLISSITWLSLALISYALHDTLQLWLASKLKHRVNGRLEGFPADIVSYFNLQRLLLTFSFGFGWSSEQHFLYTSAHQFKRKRLAVVLIHVISPVIYLLLGLVFSWLAYAILMLEVKGLRIPYVVDALALLSNMNFTMMALMLLPIPPLSMGLAITAYYSAPEHQDKRKQVYFYGTLALAVILIIQSLSGDDILPINDIKQYIYQGLKAIRLLKFV